jgi:hypothetical protein
MKIIVETADPAEAARLIADVSRSLRVYSRNEVGSVGAAVKITSITIEATPEEIEALTS